MAQPSTPALAASYTSPAHEPFSLSHPLARLPAPPSVADKSAYLAALRAAAAAAQDRVNRELTSRMELDKARDGGAPASADEVKEEENYGEEVQGED